MQRGPALADVYSTTILLKFNLSSILSEATCNSANFYIYLNNSPINRTISIREILSTNGGWIEACTWNYTDGAGASDRWAGDTGNDGGEDGGCSVSGIDYNETPLGTFVVASEDTLGHEYISELTVASIENWFGLINTNYGIVLTGALWDNINFCSSNHTTESYRPKLVVQYTIPVILTQNYSLTIQDAIQAQTTESVVLTAYSGVIELTIQDAAQSQTSDNINLTFYAPSGALTVQNATQTQKTFDNTEHIFIDGYDGNVFTACDSFIASSPYNTSNNGGSGDFEVGYEGTWTVRGLIKFNLDSIPENSKINTAILSMYFFYREGSGTRATNLYRQKKNWIESEVTWDRYSVGNNWTTSGGFDSSDCEQTPVSTSEIDDTYGWKTWNIDTESIEAMLSGGSWINYGYLVKDATETVTFKDYHTSDYVTDQTLCPKINIEYLSPIITLNQNYSLSVNNATQAQTSNNVILTYRGIIITLNHEIGDFSEYGRSPSDAHMTVSPDGAMGGTTFGVKFEIVDTNNLFIFKKYLSNTGIARARFYIDPNSVSMSDGGNFVIGEFHADEWGFDTACFIRMGYSSGNYEVYGQLRNDSGSFEDTSHYTITNKPHWIEFTLKRATTNISSDGYLDLYIDDVYQGSVAGKDNYDRFTYFWGYDNAVALFSGTISGIVYTDEIVVNNTGEYIGPLPWLIIHDSASQGQTSDNITLTTHGITLTVQNTIHSQYCDGATGTPFIVDDFNRADGGMGADWTLGVVNGLIVESNQAHLNTTAWLYANYNESYGANQKAGFTTISPVGTEYDIQLKAQGLPGSYCIEICYAPVSGTLGVWTLDIDGWEESGTTLSGISFSSGDIFWAEAFVRFNSSRVSFSHLSPYYGL